MTVAALAFAALALLAGCGSESPTLTQAQREDQFWTAYERRTGLVGTDYADPVRAKAGSISYGHFLCGELTKGVDRSVLVSQGSRGSYSREEFTVQLDTAIEFLCPEQA